MLKQSVRFHCNSFNYDIFMIQDFLSTCSYADSLFLMVLLNLMQVADFRLTKSKA